MVKYHNLNGKIVPLQDALIMVNDVGLLRGYGIFDFFPIRRGLPLFEEDYFNRFYRSAKLMGLEVPVDRLTLHDRVVELASVNHIVSGYTKLVLTGGNAIDGYTPGDNNLYVLQHGDISTSKSDYEHGIHLLLQKYLKDQPQIKTLHYANALIHREVLKQHDALDILYHDGRNIRETSRANFFMVSKSGSICTTPSHILGGITRKHVLHVIRSLGWSVEESALPIYELVNASECFITSTTKGVLPVSRVGQFTIGNGRAGEVSKALHEHFLRYCEDWSMIPN